MLTVTAAALVLGVSPSTVRRLLQERQLRYVRIRERCIRIDPTEIERYKAKAGQQGAQWQSSSTMAGGTSNFNSGANAYIDDYLAVQAKATRKRSKRPSAKQSLRLVTSA